MVNNTREELAGVLFTVRSIIFHVGPWMENASDNLYTLRQINYRVIKRNDYSHNCVYAITKAEAKFMTVKLYLLFAWMENGTMSMKLLK